MNNQETNTTSESKTIIDAIVNENWELSLYTIGEVIYIPYIDIANSIYKVLEATVQWYNSSSTEEGTLMLAYKVTVPNMKDTTQPDEDMLINVLGTCSKESKEIEEYLSWFINENIVSLKDLNIKLEQQLQQNVKHIEVFENIKL